MGGWQAHHNFPDKKRSTQRISLHHRSLCHNFRPCSAQVDLHSGSVFLARFTPPARGPCLELRGWCTLGGGALSDPYDSETYVFVVRPTR